MKSVLLCLESESCSVVLLWRCAVYEWLWNDFLYVHNKVTPVGVGVTVVVDRSRGRTREQRPEVSDEVGSTKNCPLVSETPPTVVRNRRQAFGKTWRYQISSELPFWKKNKPNNRSSCELR
ncbi:hypothetical protein Y032_0003g1623 [Ancylostoma ceylanicum]|nr:hypothetical protein Y032_0003g1623 [Ancylostoma ceylanicum]